MRILILVVLFICLTGQAFAQIPVQILANSRQKLTVDIDLAAENLGPVSLNPEDNTITPMIAAVELNIQSGEIIIRYQLASVKEGHFYEVTPSFTLDGNLLRLSLHNDFRGNLGRPIQAGENQIAWINPLDRYINIKGNLQLTLEVKLWGEPEVFYDCTLGEPEFNARQRLPYYVAAGVGLASIGGGQIARSLSKDRYQKDYLGKRQELSAEQAKPILKDINGQRHTYLLMTYAGAAVLVADAALFFIRQRRHKRDLALYRQYCNPVGVTVKPLIEWPSDSQLNGQIGARFTLSF